MASHLCDLAEHATKAAEPEASLRALTALREEVDNIERAQVARMLTRGRSFGAVARVLGISRQAAHRRYRDLASADTALPAPTPSRGRVLITSEARAAMDLARVEASKLGARRVGSEHILLGILRSGDERAAGALIGAGIDLDAARAAAQPTLVDGDARPAKVARGPRGISRYARGVLEQSLREAVGRGDGYVGVDHLLLAALADHRGGAARTLAALGVAPDKVRRALG